MTTLQAYVLYLMFLKQHPAPPPKRAVVVWEVETACTFQTYHCCPTCDGNGWWVDWFSPIPWPQTCPTCGGFKVRPVPRNYPALNEVSL